jgi:heme O synthase-like polyprenyltransferase
MMPLTLPSAGKSNVPYLTIALLVVVAAVFVYVAWKVYAHHRDRDRDRKAGVNRRHDGSHGNH